jgi:aminomethyltransferase
MEMTEDTVPLKKTPLNAAHHKLSAKMVPFVGWEMPVQFSGVLGEHLAVRTKAGLFDVSHMGEFVVTGPDAQLFLQKLTANNVAKLEPGRIQYTGLLYPEGTFVDDFLVYCYSEDHYFIVPNAANIEKDYAFMLEHAEGDVIVENVSDHYAQIALQGPLAEEILTPLCDIDLKGIAYYRFAEGGVHGKPAIVSRTGYTGEDGFEIYLAPGDAEEVWFKLLDAGGPLGLHPCGLAARDTLRLEATMALYGNDIDETTTVLEADLGWILKFKKPVDFHGKEILLKQKEEGIKRKLVGFEMIDPGIARHGYPVHVGGKKVGSVTSGSYAPFLKKNIGLTYLPIEATEIGTEFEIDLRGKLRRARVVETPFYKREH